MAERPLMLQGFPVYPAGEVLEPDDASGHQAAMALMAAVSQVQVS